MRAQTIDDRIQIGYGLAIADVDGDGRDDILLADAKQIAWYRNPGWEKFVIAENLTTRDHVCIAARDLDGDRMAEIAVGAEWNPGDTVNSGAIFLLEAPADRTQRWTPRRLPHEPTTHRMAWIRGGGDDWLLAVLPLHGRGNKNNAGDGVKFFGYPWPWRDERVPVSLIGDAPALHATHNFDVTSGSRAAGEELWTAAKEGVFAHRATAPALRSVSTHPAGEVRRGRLAGRGAFTTTIEPMHGNTLAVYLDGRSGAAGRIVLDESLLQGHALATGDLLGTGVDQIVAGWRGDGRTGSNVGIRLYAATSADGSAWEKAATIDDGKMACEDLKLADLNADGRLDVIAAGRATKNVVIYWNETSR